MTAPYRPRRRRRRLRRLAVSVAVLAVLVGAGVVAWNRVGPTGPGCTIAAGEDEYSLDTEQAANAATVAASAERLGLPHHAVTIALAAALQESKLRNLPYGDRDSLGIFQQRPSQGWGMPEQLTDPAYASRAFLQGLEKVPGWETMPVDEAAQSVQHSASTDAYADWENQARAMARAITGEAPAALSCHFDQPTSTASAAHVRSRMQAEFGPALQQDSSRWTVASWLVAHSYANGVRTVSYAGHTWTSASGAWRPDRGATDGVTARLADATTLQL